MVGQLRRFETTVAIAKESAWGTPVNPTILIPINDVSDRPTYELVIDRGLRGIGARDFRTQQAGGRGELSFEGFAMPVEIGHLILGMLGAHSVAGTTVFTHTFVMGPNPPSFTIEAELEAGVTNGGLRYAGCRLSELVFEFDAATGMLQFNSSWMSKSPTKVTGVSPAALALQDMWAGWRGTVTSSGLTSIITSATFTLSRELQVIHTAQNSQDPYIITPGPLALEGQLMLVAEDLTDFDVWKAHTSQSFVITFTYGAGDAQRSFTLTATSLNLGNGPFEIDRSGEGVLYRLPFLAIYNSTDGGPCKIVMINDFADYDP